MEITVIIPTYKPQEYLWECLDSLAAQTFPKDEYEVMIVLNGCDQPYRDRIERYMSNTGAELNIKLLQSHDSGVSKARNMALDLAQGKYLCFIDDDDYVSPSYLEELHAKASEDTIVLAYPRAFNDGETAMLPYRSADIFRSISGHGKVSLTKARNLLHITCMKLIPRQIIGNRRYDSRFSVGEDTLMMFTISDRIRFVDFTSENAVYYRRFRKGGALSTYNASGFGTRLKNSLRLALRYTGIYFSGMRRYSFFFYLTRVWGALHSIVRI